MNSFIYVVFDDGKVGIINETCHGYSFDKKWSPLMPFIQGHFVYRSDYDYESPDESRIEMGLYCIEENRKINAPFVWNHIKIKTIFEEAHNSQADIFATMKCYFERCKRDIL